LRKFLQERSVKKIKKFFDSPYFMIFVYASTLGFWHLKSQVLGVVFTIVFALLLTAFRAKKVAYITLALGLLINYRDTNFAFNRDVVFAAVGVLFPFALISFIRTKFNFKDLILIAFFIYLGTNILSLITIAPGLLDDGIYGVMQTVAFLYVYMFFHNRKQPGDQEYIAKTYTLFGLTIFLEFLFFIFSFQGTFPWNKAIELGWGVTNSIAMVLLIVFPIIIYNLLLHPKHIYITALVVALTTLLVLTMCKAAYIAFAILIIPFFIYTLFTRKTKEQKKYFWISIISSFLLSVVAFFIAYSSAELVEGFKTYILQMDSRGWFNDAARIEIYQYAWDLFKQNPLFGTGSFTAGYYLTQGLNAPLLKHFHNFIMQMLATVGSIGFLAFSFLIIAIIKKAFSKSIFNICVLFAVMAMVIHGLMDNTFHNPLIMFNIVILVAFLEEAPEYKLTDIFYRKKQLQSEN
jgi:O-antigen ligase